jgi:monovalent cation:H+ antiporter-2, CPA2 family
MNALLRDLVLLLVIAGAVLHVAHRLKAPAIAALLIAGVLIGPHGISAVHESQEIDLLAEIGIALLMFSIGLDFTRERLRQLIPAAGMGVVQMVICIVGTMLAAKLALDRWSEAVLVGFLVAPASSIVMFKLLIDRGQLRTPQGRIGQGIAITQDLAVVPMLIVVPIMGEEKAWAAGDVGEALVRGAVAVLGALALSRWLIPMWLRFVVQSRSRELFLIFVFVASLGTAWVATEMGLPLSLGAFLAGLAVAGSGYADQTLAEVVPFRDLLVSVFFISTGMLLNLDELGPILGLAAMVIPAVMCLKFLSGVIPVLIWRMPARIAMLVGLLMAQVGEFSFVLAHAGRSAGLLQEWLFQLFVLGAIVTMLFNPFLVAAGPWIERRMSKLKWLDHFEPPPSAKHGHGGRDEDALPTGHVAIAGCGLNGRNLVRALGLLGVPYIAVDADPTVVKEARARGEAVIYGDCTRLEILHRLNVKAASLYIVAVSDPSAARQTVALAQNQNPELRIIARTKLLEEITVLQSLGADDVIAEDFETSLEIIARALYSLKVPRLKIERLVQDLRRDTYQPLRGPSALPADPAVWKNLLAAIDVETVLLETDSPARGRSLREIDLRGRSGATLLAVERRDHIETVPAPDFTFEAGDLVILAGTPRQLLEAIRLFAPEGTVTGEAGGTLVAGADAVGEEKTSRRTT